MEKLDRLGWAAGVGFSAYGRRLGIRVSDGRVLEGLLDRLPPGRRPLAFPSVDRLYSLRVGGQDPGSGIRRFHVLYGNTVRLARSTDLDEALDRLEEDLRLYVARAARRRIFVHAGVVGWRGRAIVIPGRTFTGKSSLVAAMVRAGATYYSDEYAVFDPQGRVHPYPTPLSLREAGAARPQRLPAEALGRPVGVVPLPVGLIVASRYHPGARWRPRRLSPGEAILALLAETVAARSRPAAALAALRQAVSGAVALRGRRGEAEVLAGVLMTGLEG
jgi:hypothetical protein